jgi:hypothetical protein
VRFHSRPARSSDFREGTLARLIFDTITGPGVAKRIAEDRKRPKIYSANHGIRFDPKWQDDIIASTPPQ